MELDSSPFLPKGTITALLSSTLSTPEDMKGLAQISPLNEKVRVFFLKGQEILNTSNPRHHPNMS